MKCQRFLSFDGEEYTINIDFLVFQENDQQEPKVYLDANWITHPKKYLNAMGDTIQISEQAVNLAFYLALVEQVQFSKWKMLFGENIATVVGELIAANVLILNQEKIMENAKKLQELPKKN